MAKETRVQELHAVHDARKSFYGKATLVIQSEREGVAKETRYKLYSYDTFIAEVTEYRGGRFISKITKDTGHLTQTTLRHLKEFMLQLGLEPKVKKEWVEYISKN